MTRVLKRFRPFRFSTRHLLLAVLLLGCGCAWFSVKWQQAEVQRRAADRVREMGGAVGYVHEDKEGHPKTLLPRFLIEWLGADFWYDVDGVYWSSIQSQDEDVALLEFFPNLKSADISGEFTDAWLAYLRHHHELVCLSISPGDDFTGAGLLHLEELRKLTELYIYSEPLSYTGMERLARLTTLEELNVKVPDDAYAECLAELPELRSLSLQNSPISGDAIRHLGGLAKLEYVNLQHTKVNGPGIEALANLRRLRTLDLSCTPVTDDDMRRLSAIPNLKTLNLWQTNVTDEGVRHLFGMKSLKRVKLPAEISPAMKQQLTDEIPGIRL